jgi:membrane-associated phospholipid phosphatase
MNLTDRIYLAVHLALTLLVCVRHEQVEHWPVYAVWNVVAMVAIVLLARNSGRGAVWEFAHDWLPAILFITVFEEVSFLSLAIRGQWQNPHVIGWEAAVFAVPPMEWLHQHAREWVTEFLEFGYFAFYPLYPAVAGVLWAWRRRAGFVGAFRCMTDTLSVGYIVCYTTYLLFPTQSPANRAGVQQIGSAHPGLFQHMVGGIQNHAGVHGNAFPSAHIMLAFLVLLFTYRYFPRVAPWLLFPILLMCVGAVYDGYHYTSDVVAGALIGIVLGAAGSRCFWRPRRDSDSFGLPTQP